MREWRRSTTEAVVPQPHDSSSARGPGEHEEEAHKEPDHAAHDERCDGVPSLTWDREVSFDLGARPIADGAVHVRDRGGRHVNGQAEPPLHVLFEVCGKIVWHPDFYTGQRVSVRCEPSGLSNSPRPCRPRSQSGHRARSRGSRGPLGSTDSRGRRPPSRLSRAP